MKMAARMIEATVDAGLPCSWVAGDEAYGNRHLATQLSTPRPSHVLAVARSHQVDTSLASTTPAHPPVRPPAPGIACLQAGA